MNFLEEYQSDQDRYIQTFVMKKRGKERTIITYKDNDFGTYLRRTHKRILFCLNEVKPSKHCYAYQKGLCTLDALKDHLDSNLFIKLDIHHFFESITEEKFFELIENVELPIEKEELKYCFYQDHLSLGFVTSPKISDLYMKNFDEKVDAYLQLHPDISYSRYCDDILISTKKDSFGEIHTFEDFLERKLAEIGLKINDEKAREFDLSKDTSVTFLGLNIVKGENGSYITISKEYILKTLDLVQKVKTMQENKDGECIKNRDKILDFMNMTIRSRVAYIYHNSKYSYNRFLKKYKNKFSEDYPWQF